jgi:uracil-DNA glycosylase family 4
MPAGFFKASELQITKEPVSRVPKCGACGLYKTCKSPKMPYSGQGKRKILLVGEAPGEEEDKQGKQFVGPTGKLLSETLRKFGIDMRRDCWLTNTLICRPPKNATPTDLQIGYCRPNLIKVIEELEPDIIVPLGSAAVSSLIGWVWKEDVGPIGRWTGWNIPFQKRNCWICPVWHPSYIARSDHKGKANPVAKVLWEYHLSEIAKLNGRPWKEVPDYKKMVEVIYEPKEVAKIIREFIRLGGFAAYDFETNMLKPDWKEAGIVTASICWNGKRTIAFPWVGEAIDAFMEFLRSSIKKIASNEKFEDRWARRVIGVPSRNWFWDTMNNGHIQDNRRDITGLKFQAFISIGAESHNDHIKDHLRSKKGERSNHILRKIDLEHLLVYNGLDSLYEYDTCVVQRKKLGYVHEGRDESGITSPTIERYLRGFSR